MAPASSRNGTTRRSFRLDHARHHIAIRAGADRLPPPGPRRQRGRTCGAKRGRDRAACCCASRTTIGSAAGREFEDGDTRGSRVARVRRGRAAGPAERARRDLRGGARARCAGRVWCMRAIVRGRRSSRRRVRRTRPTSGRASSPTAQSRLGDAVFVGRVLPDPAKPTSSGIPAPAAIVVSPRRPASDCACGSSPSVERFVDLRLGPQEQRPSEQCGDLLVRDRDGNWTYQFAADGRRLRPGRDARDPRRRSPRVDRPPDSARAAARAGAEPPVFLHHPLIMKSPTQKLSKSDGDSGIRELRARGWTPQQVISHAMALVGSG